MHRLNDIIRSAKQNRPRTHDDDDDYEEDERNSRMETSMNMDECCIRAHTLLAIATEHNIQLRRAKGNHASRGGGRGEEGAADELAGEPREIIGRDRRAELASKFDV